MTKVDFNNMPEVLGQIVEKQNQLDLRFNELIDVLDKIFEQNQSLINKPEQQSNTVEAQPFTPTAQELPINSDSAKNENETPLQKALRTREVGSITEFVLKHLPEQEFNLGIMQQKMKKMGVNLETIRTIIRNHCKHVRPSVYMYKKDTEIHTNNIEYKDNQQTPLQKALQSGECSSVTEFIIKNLPKGEFDKKQECLRISKLGVKFSTAEVIINKYIRDNKKLQNSEQQQEVKKSLIAVFREKVPVGKTFFSKDIINDMFEAGATSSLRSIEKIIASECYLLHGDLYKHDPIYAKRLKYNKYISCYKTILGTVARAIPKKGIFNTNDIYQKVGKKANLTQQSISDALELLAIRVDTGLYKNPNAN